MIDLSRRRFVGLAAGLPALGGLSAIGCAGDEGDADGWRRGPLVHLIPTASDTAFNVKASFVSPPETPPVLAVGDRGVPGEQMDTRGRFFAFRIGGLAPDTEYPLRLLRGASNEPLCDPWPLRTLPAPEARPERLRIGSFTCAGGVSLPFPPALFHPYKPIAYRQRLFDLLLAQSPDLVIANGDHVYFDLPLMTRLQSHPLASLVLPFVEGAAATFDETVPVFGGANETALTTVGDDQIASIYGVRFRSTPVFFVTDDHDYFDNDDATPERVTLPPDAFHRALRDGLQRLYWPEFLATDEGAAALPGGVAHSETPLATYFGRVRYGDLFAGLFYDCGGFLSMGEGAGLVPPAVEAWLVAETRREDTLHLAHVPSHPMGWTAGKWREWYRDRLESTGSLVEAIRTNEDGSKYLWQPGWWAQHQRLLTALSAQTKRRALTLSGDLHALGAVRIEASGAQSLTRQPVVSILSGPVGVGELGWPSRARGVAARIPEDLAAESLLDLDERNGFTLVDLDRGAARIQIFGCPPGYVSPDRIDLDVALSLELTIA